MMGSLWLSAPTGASSLLEDEAISSLEGYIPLAIMVRAECAGGEGDRGSCPDYFWGRNGKREGDHIFQVLSLLK